MSRIRCQLVVGVWGVFCLALGCPTAVVSGRGVVKADAPERQESLLGVRVLNAVQAAEIVRRQQAKPRLPAAEQAAEVGAAIEAAIDSPDELQHYRARLVAIRQGSSLNWLSVLEAAAAANQGHERIVLAAGPDGVCKGIANRFADFLHLPAIAKLPADAAATLAEFPGGLNLSGLTELDSVPLARTLARLPIVTLPRLQTIGDAAAAALAEAAGPIEVPNLRSLRSPALARKLAAQPEVRLDRLQDLRPDVAAALVGGGGLVSLGGLQTVTANLARPLAACRGSLLLGGVRTLPPEVAEILAACPGTVWLYNLESVGSVRLVEKLARQEHVMLAVTELPVEIAKALAACRGTVTLHDLKRLTPDAAEALAACPGVVTMVSLESLESQSLAEKLARQDRVELGVREVTPAIARSLAKCAGELVLKKVESLPPAVAEILAGETAGRLDLSGLRVLDSPALARRLLGQDAESPLNEVEQLSPAAVEAILAVPGPVSLPNLQGLDSVALAKKIAGPAMHLNVTTLTPEVAAILARAASEILVLGRLQTPSPAVLEALAACEGDLSLPAKGVVTEADAAVLAKARCRSLSLGIHELTPDLVARLGDSGTELRLSNVSQLSEATVDALAESRLRVVFNSLQLDKCSPQTREKLLLNPRAHGQLFHDIATLSPAIARALAGRKDAIHLSALRRFDNPNAVEIATILAAKHGPLALPRLEAISPRTLSALLQKTDLELPAARTLKLIPEPDGGPTEDFVVPSEWQEWARGLR